MVRPASKLSLLVGLAESFSSLAPGECSSRSPTQRSPRSFAYDGAVGLRIVAAMNDVPTRVTGDCGPDAIARAPGTAMAPRSEPIPIISARPSGLPRQEYQSEEEGMELSESYTCVVSHVGGGDSVRMRVYLDVDGDDDCWGGWFGMFSGSPPPTRRETPLPVADFLSRCFLCRRRLNGLDIFMYRGDKAFCSEECRRQQMIGDEHQEKCVSDARKPFDCSVSPYSTPLLFPAGVAAA